MIIILPEADFSAVSIGKIEIKKSLTARQKKMLSMYSKELDYNKKIAFGTFIDSLDNSGIMNKIKALCMPILAGNISEAFINLASEGYTKEIEVSDEYYSLENDGIANISTQNSTAEGIIFKSISGLNSGDMHILCAADFTKEVPAEASGTVYLYQSDFIMQHNYIKSTSKIYISAFSINSVNGNTLFGQNAFINYSGYATKVYGTNIYDNVLTEYGDTKYAKHSVLEGQEESLKGATVTELARLNGNAMQTMKFPHWILSIGEGLTESELNSYSQFMMAFLSEFNK